MSDGVARGGLTHDLSGTENGLLNLKEVDVLDVQGWVAAGLKLDGCDLFGYLGGNGSTDTIRASIINPSDANRCALFRACKCRYDSNVGFYVDAESGGQDGVRVLDSRIVFTYGMEVNNCANGLSLIEATVLISGGLTSSTGNSGWGIRVRRGSFVLIDQTPSTPSVSGTLGDVEADSGSTTWATLAAGTALVDPVEMASVYVDTTLIQEAGW